MIRIFVDVNWIGVPKPGGCKRDIGRSHAPVEIVQEETVRPTTSEAKLVARAKTTTEPAALPRTLHLIAPIIAVRMSHPFTVSVHVRSFGVSGFIREPVRLPLPGNTRLRFAARGSGLLLGSALLRPAPGSRRGTVRRRSPGLKRNTGSAMPLFSAPFLREDHGRADQEE